MQPRGWSNDNHDEQIIFANKHKNDDDGIGWKNDNDNDNDGDCHDNDYNCHQSFLSLIGWIINL